MDTLFKFARSRVSAFDGVNTNIPLRVWRYSELKSEGFKPTGYPMTTSAAHWEMRKAAIALDTPFENLTAFYTENGWIHFAKPGKRVGGGYIDHAMLP